MPGTSGFFKQKQILRKGSAPGSEAARDKWLLQNKSIFCQRFCPMQRSCPGQVVCSKRSHILRKSSAPGSEAARDKWLLRKKSVSSKSSAPGSEVARDKWFVQKKVRFLRKVLPQAAKLPGTSGLSKKKRPIFETKFCPRQRSCLGQVACSKKGHVSRKSSAPGSEAARDKWSLQKKSDF